MTRHRRSRRRTAATRTLIMPFGEIDPGTLGSLARILRKTYGCETVLAGRAAVPERAYHPRRRQYRSTRILQELERVERMADELVLGAIDADLYVPELNFVSGEADVMARVAVIGLPRLRQEYYGLDPDRELFLLRAAKEAVHEPGHTCGLGHCRDRTCVMHFSNSLQDTDVKSLAFCAACRKTIETGEEAGAGGKVPGEESRRG